MTTIGDLSRGHVGKRIQLCCFGVYVQPYRNNKVYFTDFTSNDSVWNSYAKSFEFGKIVDLCESKMLYQVDCFQELWDPLVKTYRNFHKEDLCENSLLNEHNNFDITSKLFFARITVLCKTYKGVLEGKLIDSQLLERDESAEAHNLYKRFFQYSSPEFIRENNVMLKTLVPKLFWGEIENAISSGSRGNSNSNTQQSMPNVVKQERIDDFVTQVKKEEILNGLDTGNLPSSPANSEDMDIPLPLQSRRGTQAALQESTYAADYAPLHQVLDLNYEIHDSIFPGQPTNPTGLESSHPGDQVPPHVHTNSAPFRSISELNDILFDSTLLEATTYRTRGFIVGVIPEDLSLVCAKDYIFDLPTSKYKLGDPFLRELEILICDDEGSATQDGPLRLTESNSMKITFEEDNVLKFFNDFDHEYVETFYTKVNLYNHILQHFLRNNPRKFFDIEVTKKSLRPETLNIPIWESSTISIMSIRKYVGDSF